MGQCDRSLPGAGDPPKRQRLFGVDGRWRQQLCGDRCADASDVGAIEPAAKHLSPKVRQRRLRSGRDNCQTAAAGRHAHDDHRLATARGYLWRFTARRGHRRTGCVSAEIGQCLPRLLAAQPGGGVRRGEVRRGQRQPLEIGRRSSRRPRRGAGHRNRLTNDSGGATAREHNAAYRQRADAHQRPRGEPSNRMVAGSAMSVHRPTVPSVAAAHGDRHSRSFSSRARSTPADAAPRQPPTSRLRDRYAPRSADPM